MNFADLKICARRFCEQWLATRVVAEGSANGSALALDLRKEKLPFKTLSVKGSKEERFAIAAEYLETGKIALLEDAPYFQDLRRELLSFPTGRYDDQVDALSLFVRRLRLPRPLFPKKR